MTNENKAPNLIDNESVIELKNSLKRLHSAVLCNQDEEYNIAYARLNTLISSLPLEQVEQGAKCAEKLTPEFAKWCGDNGWFCDTIHQLWYKDKFNNPQGGVSLDNLKAWKAISDVHPLPPLPSAEQQGWISDRVQYHAEGFGIFIAVNAYQDQRDKDGRTWFLKSSSRYINENQLVQKITNRELYLLYLHELEISPPVEEKDTKK